MVASLNRFVTHASRWRRTWLTILLVPPIALAALSWWFTEPLTDHGAPSNQGSATIHVPADIKKQAAEEKIPLAWPDVRLEGREAKLRLLDILVAAAERLNQVESYTATFRKQERIKGELKPEQTLAMKVRQKPFAIYFKFLSHQEGKEVVYAEGHHDNKVVAHPGGVARFLMPRLALAPDDPLALADSRHPVTDAGLSNLTDRLLHFRRIDLDDSDAVTVLDRTTDANGRPWLRSIHTHTIPSPDRPFARIEVLYDPETFIPKDIRNFDWGQPGQLEDLPLAEHYNYDDLKLDAMLSALDFDPANPAYAFHRY